MNISTVKNIVMLLKEKIFDELKWSVGRSNTNDSVVGSQNTGSTFIKVNTGSKVLRIKLEYKKIFLSPPMPVKSENWDMVIYATSYIPPSMMERIKANRASVIDEVGNCFFYYERGKERVMFYEFGHVSEKKRPPRVQAFSPKACYVAMALLHAKDFEMRTMRDLQIATKLSLGGIYGICNAMKRNGLIDYSHSKTIRINEPTRFLDEFATYYKLNLAPKIQRHGYLLSRKKIIDKESGETTVERVNWREGATAIQEEMPKTALTGVQAAQSVTRYYTMDIGEILVSHRTSAEVALMQQFVLTPTGQRPDFYLIEPYNNSAFIQMSEGETPRTANPIQIYLDLVSSEDQRANELGEIYREEKIGY
jgi:hypothetical protein